MASLFGDLLLKFPIMMAMLGTVKPNCPLTLKWILDCSDLHFLEYIFYCAVTFLFTLLSISFIKILMIVDINNHCTVVDLSNRPSPLVIFKSL